MATFPLPAELVEYVLASASQSDLYAVCQVNRALHTLALPFLYRTVNLQFTPQHCPRIDWFCRNIVTKPRYASYVNTLRMGPLPNSGVKDGQRWLSQDPRFDDALMTKEVAEVFERESFVADEAYLRDAITMREYGAYAVVVLMVLPGLEHLELADYDGVSLHHLHTFFRHLGPTTPEHDRQQLPSQSLRDRLSSIKIITYNHVSSRKKGSAGSNYNFQLHHILNIPRAQQLKLYVSEPHHTRPGRRSGILVPSFVEQFRTQPELIHITTIVVKHSSISSSFLTPLFRCIQQLRIFTYEFFHDCADYGPAPTNWIDLFSWTDALRPYKSSLISLALSVEYCDTSLHPFQQPRIHDKLRGCLDLTEFEQLRTLEVPIPFLTGDAEFAITTDIYPLLPPKLTHLSLRTDLTHAQFQYPMDMSILPKSLTFQESEAQARSLMSARMDLSYMMVAMLSIIEFAPVLDRLSIWQPIDPSLSWFDGQLQDFATTCNKKSIIGSVLYPMLLRWKKAEHWSLVQANSTANSERMDAFGLQDLYREEREGVPLGLACQYHLHALNSHQVELRSKKMLQREV